MGERARNPIDEIKRGLQLVYSATEKILPPEEMHVHPMQWLGRRLEGVLEALGSLREEVEREVGSEEARVGEIERELSEVAASLGHGCPPAAGGPWKAAVNLRVKRAALEEALGSLKSEYKRKEEAMWGSVERIRVIWAEIHGELADDASARARLGISAKAGYWITDEEVRRVGEMEVQEEARLREIQKEKAKNIGEISRLTKELGVGIMEASPSETMKRLQAILEFAHGGSAGSPLSLGPGCVLDECALCGYTSCETKGILGALREIDFAVQERRAALSRRMELIRTRMSIPADAGAEIEPGGRGKIAEVRRLEEGVRELEEEYRRNFKKMLDSRVADLGRVRQELEEATGEAYETGCNRLLENLSVEDQEEIVGSMDGQLERLRGEASIISAIKERLAERADLLDKMVLFEEQASDPKRLFRSSFQLISEERFRKMAVPTLLRLEREVLDLAASYREKYEKEARICREEVVGKVGSEIGRRIINTNVFINAKTGTPKKRPANGAP